MEKLSPFLLGLAAMLAGAAVTLWFIWSTIKKSEDPGRIIYKWVISGIAFCILVFGATQIGKFGVVGAFAGPILAAVMGVFLGILWAPHIGALIAKPFTALYDGGETEAELKPLYSMARAKQKRGLYEVAIAEINRQLEQFPGDYDGLMFLAEINAQDLKNNAEAQRCVCEIISGEGAAPRQVVYALNRSADWHLELAGDRESAKASLQQIVERFPGSEFAHTAAQRLAHLTTDQMLSEQKERPTIHLVHRDEYIGLKGEVADPRAPETEPAAKAGQLVQHLQSFPEDVEAREQLATIYAEHYKRMDLAGDQLERLIELPGATQKEIAHWLNMLVDFHVRVDGDRAAAKSALERLMTMFPRSAVGSLAESRIAHLDGEFRRNSKSQVLKLGSYEDNLGLKGQVPKSRN